ncbi:MAG: hypothetical protein SFU56_03785 [Capsulimonadales bacterium]|nr:hypothetical protein [Capsulimonadales bacterium]
MLRKGIVERQVEALVRTLFLLKRREEEGALAEVRQGLTAASKELTGIPWNLARTMTAESLLGLLRNGSLLDAGRAAVLAVLLHEHGMREESIDSNGAARTEFSKALVLLEAAVESEPLLRTAEFEERLADLRVRLGVPNRPKKG